MFSGDSGNSVRACYLGTDLFSSQTRSVLCVKSILKIPEGSVKNCDYIYHCLFLTIRELILLHISHGTFRIS